LPLATRTSREPPLSASLGRGRTSETLKLPVSSTAERECVKNSSPVPRWLSCHCFASSACFSSLLLPPPKPGIQEVILGWGCEVCERRGYAGEQWFRASGNTSCEWLDSRRHSLETGQSAWLELKPHSPLHHRRHAGTESRVAMVRVG
jgi:hypothetical protein